MSNLGRTAQNALDRALDRMEQISADLLNMRADPNLSATTDAIILSLVEKYKTLGQHAAMLLAAQGYRRSPHQDHSTKVVE